MAESKSDSDLSLCSVNKPHLIPSYQIWSSFILYVVLDLKPVVSMQETSNSETVDRETREFHMCWTFNREAETYHNLIWLLQWLRFQIKGQNWALRPDTWT